MSDVGSGAVTRVANRTGGRCVVFIMVTPAAVRPKWKKAVGVLFAASLVLVPLGSITAAAAATEHHAHHSAKHDHRHRRATRPPFCGEGIMPQSPGDSEPLVPPNATRSSVTLLPCYKVVLPNRVQTTRP